MRCTSRSISDNGRPPCTPPHQKSMSLSGRLASPASPSPLPSMKSLSGRLTPPSTSSASQVIPQASPSNTQQQVVELDQFREQHRPHLGHQRSASSARRSLERSWSSESLSLGERSPIRVSLPDDRKSERKPTIPAPVPVVHSSTYLKSTQRYATESEGSGADTPVAPVVQVSKASTHRRSNSTDNALEWAMCRADRNLDELERNPLPFQKAFYDFSRGPVGEMTNSAAQAAAKLTLAAGQEVTRASIPVGKWALKEGIKAAGGLIQAQHSRRRSFEQKKGEAN